MLINFNDPTLKKKKKKTIDFNAWNNWTISQYNLLSSVGIYQKLTFGYI